MNETEKYFEAQRLRVEPLRQKYPTLFSQLQYIDCQDGWFPLIEDLCEAIQRYTRSHVPDELKDQLCFTQIKQKFGELRVHMNHWNDYIQGAISMAEGYSIRVCEKCGEKGQTYNIRNWITTLCPKHHEEELHRRPK
jgi:hypothetical protein